ncbi:hypothetical protein TKK_0001024 [Trichogramma kaykai]|uniref:C2H2-type domain-containing protein n=1 Tax=Trichogramma kaykai TaxID=54128 RepID=A0ABD2WT35_9HYME
MDIVEDRTKTFKCLQCDHKFIHPTTLKRHVEKIHNDNFFFKCTVCHKKFSKSFDLNAHIKSVHEKLKELKCDQCDEKFTRALDLDKHIRTQHNSIKKLLKCFTCGAAFSRHCNLEMHVKTVHTNSNSFEYIICDKKFNSQNTLKTHIEKIHVGNVNHECQKCHKKFYKIENYKKHINIAHPEMNEYPEFKRNIHDEKSSNINSIHVNMNELSNKMKMEKSPEKVVNEKLSTDHTCDMLHQESNVKISKSNEPYQNLVISTNAMNVKDICQESHNQGSQQTINDLKTENSLIHTVEENNPNQDLKAIGVPQNLYIKDSTIGTFYSTEEKGSNNAAMWNIVSKNSVQIQCFNHNLSPTQTIEANVVDQNSNQIEYINNTYSQNHSTVRNLNAHMKFHNDKNLPNVNSSHETKFSNEEYSSNSIYGADRVGQNILNSEFIVINHAPQLMPSYNGRCLPDVSNMKNVENKANPYCHQTAAVDGGFLPAVINSQPVTNFNDNYLPNISNTKNFVCHTPRQATCFNEFFPQVVNIENTRESTNTESYCSIKEEPSVSFKNYEQTFPSESSNQDVPMNFEPTNMFVENVRQSTPFEIFNEYSKIKNFNEVIPNNNIEKESVYDKTKFVDNQELNHVPFTCSETENFLDDVFHYYIDEFDKLIHGNDENQLNNLLDELNKTSPDMKFENILDKIDHFNMKMDALPGKFMENLFEMVNFIEQVENVKNGFDSNIYL